MTDLVILVGGKGKRLGKLTKTIPKPLIKINKKPFLDILLSKLISYEFSTIYLLCSFKKKLFFTKYHRTILHKSRIICIDEGKQKDTGGALYKIRNKIKDNFFLINGDSFLDIDFNLISKISLNRAIGTIVTTNNQNYKKNNKINNLKIDNQGFIELSNNKTKLMNGGIYFFKKKIFDYVSNKKSSLENDILDKLIKRKKIKGINSNNKFIDIGSIKNLNLLKKNPNIISQKAVFLDRDGVINKLNPDGYILDFNQFKLLPGVGNAINFLNKNGYLVIIVTNQACVGKLILTEKKLHKIHEKMKKKIFVNNQGLINDIYYSPYYKYSKNKKYRINLKDRKPNPGMIIKAIKKWNLRINDSFFVGDSISDYNAAKKIGLRFFYKDNGFFDKQIKRIINK
tara:strand:- start:2154 stop:3347 length:1194 start_codon:yes stop_codon:yes gene_type:complete